MERLFAEQRSRGAKDRRQNPPRERDISSSPSEVLTRCGIGVLSALGTHYQSFCFRLKCVSGVLAVRMQCALRTYDS